MRARSHSQMLMSRKSIATHLIYIELVHYLILYRFFLLGYFFFLRICSTFSSYFLLLFFWPFIGIACCCLVHCVVYFEIFFFFFYLVSLPFAFRMHKIIKMYKLIVVIFAKRTAWVDWTNQEELSNLRQTKR